MKTDSRIRSTVGVTNLTSKSKFTRLTRALRFKLARHSNKCAKICPPLVLIAETFPFPAQVLKMAINHLKVRVTEL